MGSTSIHPSVDLKKRREEKRERDEERERERERERREKIVVLNAPSLFKRTDNEKGGGRSKKTQEKIKLFLQKRNTCARVEPSVCLLCVV